MPSDLKRPSYRARSRRRYRIKARLNLGGEYTEADGTVWKYRSDLIDAEHPAPGPVEVAHRLTYLVWMTGTYSSLDAALEKEEITWQKEKRRWQDHTQ